MNPRDSAKGTHKGWFIGVIPSFPAPARKTEATVLAACQYHSPGFVGLEIFGDLSAALHALCAIHLPAVGSI